MKKICFLLVTIFCLPMLVVGCENKTQLNNYKITAVYEKQQHTLTCTQETTYVNNTENALREVCFYLYANAFADSQKAVPTSYNAKAYPNGESYGGIEFSKVADKSSDLEYTLSENKNILTVQILTLYPNESFTFEFEYVVSLANINHRLGYGNNTANFGSFFPIACVYEEDGTGFVKNGYSASGDPFYSDVSNFAVEFVCGKEFVVASTGNKQEQIDGQNKISYCTATNVRDFCLVISKEFETLSQDVNGVQVNYFFYEDADASKHLETAVLALQTFEDLFGEYPYQQLSVVKNNFCFGGMEYPNLVMISDGVTESEAFNYVIVHEIAHQWWYGLVGNNEFDDAWIDEGLTEFSTALFYEQHQEYGVDYETIMQNATNGYKNFVEIYTKINGDVDESMNRSLNDFDTEPEYVNCIYTKGMLLFDSVRKSIGDRKFFKCLKNYYKTYIFQNSSSEKLIENFCKISKIDLYNYFSAWIYGNVVIK